MPCYHKFYGHENHLPGNFGLLPNWDADTLIIGTFNPANLWVPNNLAEYYYGRSRYFWKTLTRLGCSLEIENQDVNGQLTFLQEKRIALTDLLISVNDADINNPQNVGWIRSFLDNDLANFNDFSWNTPHIIDYILTNNIQAVCFTRLGNAHPFGQQMQIIESFCELSNISHYRLHTPTGLGLGKGTPRLNKLVHRWYSHNGGNQFPFLCPDFDINSQKLIWH